MRRQRACAVAGGLWLLATCAPALPCPLAADQTGRIARIGADGSLTLEDGRTLRGAHLDLPADGKASVAWRSRLAPLVAARIHFRALADAPDRWGRIIAQVVIAKEEEPLRAGAPALGAQPGAWLEDLLIAEGLARVRPEATGEGCARALLARENEARRTGAGLWGEPAHAVRKADNPGALLGLVGTFAIVEGTVISVGERTHRVFLNFGRRWSEDMTVVMSKRNWRMLAEQGMSAGRLTGQRIRVRGLVEDDHGPSIEVTVPEDIEWVEADRSR